MIHTDILYKTPNNEWCISSQYDLFDSHIFYTAWKKFGEEWQFRFYRDEIESIFRWLKWNKIISNDEMIYQIESFQSLTDKKE